MDLASQYSLTQPAMVEPAAQAGAPVTAALEPLRFRGGGGDGGSTGAESRSSYLEMYKERKEDKVDPAQLRCVLSYCASAMCMPDRVPSPRNACIEIAHQQA